MAARKIYEFEYAELREKAIAFNAKQEDIQALADWFELYAPYQYWNGESYNIDDGYRLYPVYDWENFNEDEDDVPERIGWEVRR